MDSVSDDSDDELPPTPHQFPGAYGTKYNQSDGASSDDDEPPPPLVDSCESPWKRRLSSQDFGVESIQGPAGGAIAFAGVAQDDKRIPSGVDGADRHHHNHYQVNNTNVYAEAKSISPVSSISISSAEEEGNLVDSSDDGGGEGSSTVGKGAPTPRRRQSGGGSSSNLIAGWANSLTTGPKCDSTSLANTSPHPPSPPNAAINGAANAPAGDVADTYRLEDFGGVGVLQRAVLSDFGAVNTNNNAPSPHQQQLGAARRKSWLQEREAAMTDLAGPAASEAVSGSASGVLSGAASASGAVASRVGATKDELESDVDFSSDSAGACTEEDDEGEGPSFTLSPEAMLREGQRLRALSASLTPDQSPATAAIQGNRSLHSLGLNGSGAAAKQIHSPASSELAEFMDELQDLDASTNTSPTGKGKDSGGGSIIALGSGLDRSSITFSPGAGSPRGEAVPKPGAALHPGGHYHHHGHHQEEEEEEEEEVERESSPASRISRICSISSNQGNDGGNDSGSSNYQQSSTHRRKSEHIDPDRTEPMKLVLPPGAQRAQAVTVEYDGPPGTLVISWEFYVDQPLKFGLFLKDTPTSTKQKKWTACIPAKAFHGSSAPSIGSWACNATGTYVMLFTNPNPNKEACVYVRAHALDLAAWEDAQSLALLGLVNRRPVIGHDVRTAPTTTSPSASASTSASASASKKQRARARSPTSATFSGGAEAAIEDGSLNTFVATPLFNLDVDELSAVAAWLDSAIVKANMCLIEGLGNRDELQEQKDFLEHRLHQTAKGQGYASKEEYIATIVEPDETVDAGTVPWIYQSCIDYLSRPEVLSEVGLFRVSGSKSQISTLASRFDTDGSAANLEDVMDPAAVCGLLRVVIVETELPLSPSESYAMLMACMIQPQEERTDAVREVLDAISMTAYTALHLIVSLFRKILVMQKYNRMTVRNLGLTIGLTAFPGIEQPHDVIAILTTEYADFFPCDEAEEAAEAATVLTYAASSIYRDEDPTGGVPGVSHNTHV